MTGRLQVTDLGLLTYAEAAAIADVKVVTVRAWVTRYGLRTRRVEGVVHVVEVDFLACERARRNSGRRGGGSRPGRRVRDTPSPDGVRG